MSVALKKCPFCGREAELANGAGGYYFTDVDGGMAYQKRTYTVKCRNSYCGCSIGNYQTGYMAIEAWNSRILWPGSEEEQKANEKKREDQA